jgi:hypothetical protein
MSSSTLYKMPLIVMGIFLLHTFGVLTHNAFAADSIHVDVSPRLQHYIVKPGASASAQLKVINYGDPTYLSFTIEHDPSISIVATSTPRSVKLGEVALFEKNMQLDFHLNITQDENQLFEKDNTITFITSSKNIFATHRTGLNIDLEPQINSQIVLSSSLDGTLDMRPRIRVFQNPQGRVVMNSSDQTVDLLIQNTVKHMTYVSGTIKVIDPSGQTETTSVPRIAVFAQDVRKVTGSRGQGAAALWFPQNRLKIGRYQAFAELTIPGPDRIKLYSQTTFFVLSETLVIVVIGLVLVLFGCILYVYFNYLHTRAWKPISIQKSSLNS